MPGRSTAGKLLLQSRCRQESANSITSDDARRPGPPAFPSYFLFVSQSELRDFSAIEGLRMLGSLYTDRGKKLVLTNVSVKSQDIMYKVWKAAAVAVLEFPQLIE